MQLWTHNLKSLLNLFLKPNCPLCQRPTFQVLCQQCEKRLQKCYLPNPGIYWQRPLPVFAWGAYNGILKQAIATMKYNSKPEIARPLGQLLGQAWLTNSSYHNQRLLVVPIPLHASKQKQRGYNQAALIAHSFCETTGLKLKLNGLERVKQTQAQFGLSVSEREENLAQAFNLGKDFHRCPDLPVLLVDDIYTTGATARSAMQILDKAGITVLGLAATAVTIKGR
jgi:ComF family protein